MWKYGKVLPVDTTPTGLIYDSSLIGSKEFELTNHLGNVVSVISDKKVGIGATGGLIDYYKAEVLNQQDYYPGGMRQPNRGYSLNDYRYGFNGKENDNEVKGDGNQQDYGMRIYDTRLGRFLSVDPIFKSYPELTPYQYASNSPISGIDLDGGEYKYYALQWKDNTSTKLKVGNLVRTDNNISFTLVFKVSVGSSSYMVPVPVSIDRNLVGLSGNFVNYNGKSVRLPDGVDVNNLPAQTDPIWETFETEQELDENFLGGIRQVAENITNLAAFQGIVKIGKLPQFLKKSGLVQKVESLGTLRRRAVKAAWAKERKAVEETGRGSRAWTAAQKEELLKTGKVKGFHGHHKNPVKDYPEQAGDPSNIEFLDSGNPKGGGAKKNSEHWKAHNEKTKE